MSDIFAELQWRGLIHQTTDDEKLADWLGSGSRTLYAGFDPTADSLHVGSLLPLMLLRRFQRAGHHPIALIGGATGMIGDPSGKSAERQLLSADILQQNVVGIEGQMRRILDFDGPHAARLVNNLDWMRNLSYLDFLRDVGKNFPVNVMMAKDSVKSRLGREETGISYTEFSYMLLQAYDFVHLHQRFGCELQCGGSDQWGNITAGIDLGRRMYGAHLYGMTSPLLTKADGTKMGKTEEGAIWLSPKRTSPYQFYQYWMNVDDQDAGLCLRFLTELTMAEIQELDQQRQQQPELRAAQKALAQSITGLVHGQVGLETAEKATQIFFGAAIQGYTDDLLVEILADVPSCQVPRSTLAQQGFPLIEALAATGLCSSKGEARRVIQEGGAYVNNERTNDIELKLTCQHFASESVIVLRRGKRNFALVRAT